MNKLSFSTQVILYGTFVSLVGSALNVAGMYLLLTTTKATVEWLGIIALISSSLVVGFGFQAVSLGYQLRK